MCVRVVISAWSTSLWSNVRVAGQNGRKVLIGTSHWSCNLATSHPAWCFCCVFLSGTGSGKICCSQRFGHIENSWRQDKLQGSAVWKFQSCLTLLAWLHLNIGSREEEDKWLNFPVRTMWRNSQGFNIQAFQSTGGNILHRRLVHHYVSFHHATQSRVVCIAAYLIVNILYIVLPDHPNVLLQ